MDSHQLIEKGYRRVSNKFKMVSRVDRPDWLDVLFNVRAIRNTIVLAQLKDYYRGVDFSGTFSEESVMQEAAMCADHYRRCFSKDNIEWLDPEIFKRIPSSGGDPTGYIQK
jgi:hypothetical protein